MACYEIRGLTFTYPGQEQPALRDLTLCVEDGEFLVLCGASGSGKSTLLRQLKTVLAPHGARSGEILFGGTPLDAVPRGTQAGAIGFVLQNPENQVVTDKVWHELAFGLESLGYDTPVIRRRVAEMAAFFGIQDWFYKDVSELSGGQKQLLSLASVMVMQPRVLLLDEPTSQLDPIAAADFLAVLARINRELGTTIILSEHRLEEALSYARRAAVLEDGRLVCCAAPGEVGALLRRQGSGMFYAMPAAMRIWGAVESSGTCPVTVCEGRAWLTETFAERPVRVGEPEPEAPLGEEVDAAISMKEVWFRYEKNSPDVLRGVNLEVPRGRLFAIVGGNGAGKSTLFKLLTRLYEPKSGAIRFGGDNIADFALTGWRDRFAYVFQKDPLIGGTVRENITYGLDREVSEEELIAAAKKANCYDCIMAKPGGFDEDVGLGGSNFSGGQAQCISIARAMLRDADYLLLDEATSNLDVVSEAAVTEAMDHLMEGRTTIMIAHNFAATRNADYIIVMKDGTVEAAGTPEELQETNEYYRMFSKTL